MTLDEVIEELLAMFLGHRNQPLQPVEHARAVAQEEEQQEQHEEERHQRAQRPEHQAAADGRHAAQRRFRGAPQPFLNVRRRHRQLFPRQARQRADHRVLLEAHENAAIQLEIAAANVVHQRAGLVHELEGQQGERREQREGCEARDQACRYARLVAQLARQPAVQRVEQEGQEDGPGHRAREGLEDQQHAVAHHHGERDEEGFCIELHVHP